MTPARLAAIAIAAALACAPTEPQSQPPAVPRGSSHELALLVPAWQTVEQAWLDQATIWTVARYEELGTYPCVPGPDGSIDMIARLGFVPTRVLRGKLAARAVDVDPGALRGASYPRTLGEGRSYLVLLRPTPTMAARLADPAGTQAMHEALAEDQVVAVIDLSQTAEEHASEQVTATRSGPGFDPALWAAARSAPAITAEQHAPIARFLAEQLRPGATLAEVRAWVGAPDREERRGLRREDQYLLARPANATPVEDGVYGQLELVFMDGTLRSGSVRYLRWRRQGPTVWASSELTGDELTALGLRNHDL